MGLSPRSLAHALRLHVDSPRLRVTRTPAGRAMVFDAPPARERPPVEVAPDIAVAPETPTPTRRRFMDDPVEVGWRRGLVRAAREGLDHFVPDEPRAQALADAFGPLEPVAVRGEAGEVERMGLRFTPAVRKSVLAGRMRFAAGDNIGRKWGYEPRDLVLAFNDRVSPLDTALDLGLDPERLDVVNSINTNTTNVRTRVREAMADPAAFTALAERWRLDKRELERFVTDVEGGQQVRRSPTLRGHLRALAEQGVLDTESLTRAAREWTPSVGGKSPTGTTVYTTVAQLRAEFGVSTPQARVAAEVKRTIRTMRKQGLPPTEIARRAGVSLNVVSGAIARMKARGETFPALRGRGRFSMAGERARIADEEKLSLAREMQASGVEREKIWRETGWAIGDDGKWRFEIDTAEARLKVKPDTVEHSPIRTLEQTLEFPALYEAYPQLRSVRVDLARGIYGGSWERGLEVIVVRAHGAKSARSVLLHEIQHAIQDIEGFATGGDPKTGGPFREVVRLADEIVAERIRRWGDSPWKQIVFGDDNASFKAFEFERALAEARWESYRRLAGEVEARDVQRRTEWAPEERKALPPGADADVPAPERIVSLAHPGAAFAASAGRSTPADIEAEVRSAWNGAGATLLDTGDIRVVATHRDAPSDGFIKPPPGVGAVYLNGVTTIVANSITPARVRSLILHEVGVHAGLETMIGAKRFATLLKKVDQRVAHFRELRDRGEADPGGDMWLEARDYAESYAAHEQDIAEETIAYAVEMIDDAFKHFPDAADRTLLQSLLDAVRRWFVTTTGVGTITPRDLHTLAVASLRKRAREAGAAMALIPQSELMRLATGRGFKGSDARAALAWLKAHPPSMLEGMSRADVMGSGEPRPGKAEANTAVGAAAVGGVAAAGATAGGVGLTEFERGRDERKAAYETLAADNARQQQRLAQNEALKAERAERARAIAERDIEALPEMPADATGADQRGVYVRELADWVGEMAGIDPEFLFALMARETAYTFDPTIQNPKSSATGLGQFTESTWRSELKRSGGAYNIETEGLSGEELLALREDPRIAAAMVAAHARGNAEILIDRLQRQNGVSGAELYAAHFLGVDGAVNLIRMADARLGVEVMKRQFAGAIFNDDGEEINASVFRDERGAWRAPGAVIESFEPEFGAERRPLSPRGPTASDARRPSPDTRR